MLSASWSLRGLIPAGAGQTFAGPFRTPQHWAHPRGCGADSSSFSRAHLNTGSSPRVRGRLVDNCPHQCPVGLIPAGAGQTSRHSRRHHRRRAHPRGCGADSSHRPLANPVGGSSPQVRGRLAGPQDRWGGGGLIPAGAGQTLPPILPGCVHSSGSSPRVRGRRGGRRGDRGGLGLIPAGAGQTAPTPSPHWP